jgi:V8-like Glu-specific endopeptidase
MTISDAGAPGHTATTASSRSGRRREAFMVQTNNGGRIESVPGFDISRVMTQGFSRRVLPKRLSAESLGSASWLEFAFPESMVGKDDRVPVPNTTQTPWRCVCQLVVEGLHEEQVLGTGWFAAPRTVVTAGHNLVSHKTGRAATRVTIIPGRNGNHAPFDYFEASAFDVHPLWKEAGSPLHDLGALWLDKPVGERVGWFGFASPSDAALRRLIVNTAGYPADKRIGTQWFNAGRIDDIEAQVLHYGLDTEEGQSGSPIFFVGDSNSRVVVAVHAYGGDGSNSGIRVNDDVFDLFSGWLR